MAKAKNAKKTTVKKKPPTKRTPNTKALQSKLTRLDRELVKMFNERATVYKQFATLRQADDSVAFSSEDVDSAVENAQNANKGPLTDDPIRSMFRELASGCQSLVQTLKIAMLGPFYSYSHLAAIEYFGQSVEFVPVGNIAAVFEEVNEKHADFGIVPIENSTDGRIADTLDMFTKLPVRICGEVELGIHHTLLARCSRQDIREVYSKPQALSQCRNWLAKHVPSARLIEVTSTTTAAKLASEKPGAAAIASLQAGTKYGLNTLAERIEDNHNNSTRFAIIGTHTSKRTGNDKTAIMFQTEHRFGALADALNIFKRNRLNLTWIESFPVPGENRIYLFFVELEGYETDTRVQRAAAALEKKALRLEILGSFPSSPPVS